MGNSCKDCTERKIGCHQYCEKYKKDNEERKKIKKYKKDTLENYESFVKHNNWESRY